METAIFICLYIVLAYIALEYIIRLIRNGRIYKIRLKKDCVGNYYTEYRKTPISMWYFYSSIHADSDSEAVEIFAKFTNKEKENNPQFKDTIICEKLIKEK